MPYCHLQTLEKIVITAPKNLVVLCHGVTGSGQSCFIPWLKSQIESDSVVVLNPSFPDSSDPEYSIWVSYFHELIDNLEYDNLYILGHSLGGFFVLKLLGDELYNSPKLKGVLLVSPTSMKRPERRKFYKEAVSWENVKQVKCPITLMFSEDDPKISKQHIELILQEIKDTTNLTYKHYEHFGHFLEKESSEILQSMKELLDH